MSSQEDEMAEEPNGALPPGENGDGGIVDATAALSETAPSHGSALG